MWASSAAGQADTLGKTTLEQRIVPDTSTDFRQLGLGPGEPYLVRTELGTPQGGREARRASLAYIGQLSDFQLADEESPARVEFVDPAGPPVDAAWRPWEAMNPHIDDAMIRQINAFASASPLAGAGGARRAMDFVINTGDLADNQQLNETEWVRTLLEGGALNPGSGVAPAGSTNPLCSNPVVAAAIADGATPANYTGVQDYDDYIEGLDPQFYDPDPPSPPQPPGQWEDWPIYSGLMDAAQLPFTAVGLAVPSYVTFGNHDALVQGNQAANASFETVATGCVKPLTGAVGPDFGDALAGLNQAALEGLVGDADPSNTIFVPPDPSRRFVSKKEYKQVFESGSQPDGHGFDFVEAAEETASGGSAGYYGFGPVPGLRMISVDTTCEGGVAGPSSDGNVDDPQFRWLEGELQKATAANELVVLFSHHAIQSLTCDVPDEAAPPCLGPDSHGHDANPGCDLDTRSSQPIHLGEDMTALLHKYPHVIAWVAGHSHVNDVTAFPDGKGGGFWMIRSAAEADWPQQSRLVEIFDNRDGTLSIFGTVLDHASDATAPAAVGDPGNPDPEELASIGRTLAYNDPQVGAEQCDPGCGEGVPEDRNVELLLRDPRAGLNPGRCANLQTGTRGKDVLKGTRSGDRLLGRGGRDRVLGRRGKDCLRGQRGGDKIRGGIGADRLNGGRGRDRLNGGRGRDRMRGGRGPDLLRARRGGRDVVRCGAGKDRAVVDSRDKVRGCETVRRP